MNIFKLTKISLSLILICLAVFLGCSKDNNETTENKPYEGLTEDLELQIKQDYLEIYVNPKAFEASIEDVFIEKYYGTYGESVVVRFDCPYIEYDDTERELMVWQWGEQRLLCYSGLDRVFIWNNGHLYRFEDAVWTANTYTVSFNANQGEGELPPVIAVFGDSIPSISAYNPPAKAGNTFAGYFDTLNQTGGLMYYDADLEGTRSWDKVNNTTLYAWWVVKDYYEIGDTGPVASFGYVYSNGNLALFSTAHRNTINS